MDVKQSIIDRVVAAEAELAEAKAELSKAVMEASGLAKNTILRDVNTGALYRVAGGGAGYIHIGRPRLHLTTYRVYKTGRREATSMTSQSWPNSSLEIYKGDDN